MVMANAEAAFSGYLYHSALSYLLTISSPWPPLRSYRELTCPGSPGWRQSQDVWVRVGALNYCAVPCGRELATQGSGKRTCRSQGGQGGLCGRIEARGRLSGNRPWAGAPHGLRTQVVPEQEMQRILCVEEVRGVSHACVSL